VRTRARRPRARGRDFVLCGGNKAAFNDHASREYLLAGPAGTGKTLANLLKVRQFGEENPGARMLILRKTRVSLTETALVTWERDVLGPDHSVLAKPVTRGYRHAYGFDNGSVLVTGGMDNPDKVLSSEWDLIYCPEATDLELVDWETLGGRLRANAGDYDQLFGDCNPTTPHHWLYKRCQAGRCKLYSTTHRENPRYFNFRTARWTKAGIRYVHGRLQQMTGHRRDRFLRGLWVAAEGLIYDAFQPEVHLLPPGWEPPAHWPRVWSLDWGFNPSPIVLQFWALDPENRMYLYRETYRTRQTVADLAEWAKGELDAGREPNPAATVSDHEEEKATVFGRVTGLHVTPAEKFDKLAGIQLVQERFDRAADGLPRIFFRPDARRHEEDPFLVEAGKPLSTIEELTAYVWDTRNPDRPKDLPLDLNDHGADAMLYAVRHVNVLFGRATEYEGPRGEDLLPGWMGDPNSATGW
jgi:hypothetical protein